MHELKISLDRRGTATIQSMIAHAVQTGDPLLREAAIEFGNRLAVDMVAQIPGLGEHAEEALNELAGEVSDNPDLSEAVEDLRTRLSEASNGLTEEEVEKADGGVIADEILRQADDGESA